MRKSVWLILRLDVRWEFAIRSHEGFHCWFSLVGSHWESDWKLTLVFNGCVRIDQHWKWPQSSFKFSRTPTTFHCVPDFGDQIDAEQEHEKKNVGLVEMTEVTRGWMGWFEYNIFIAICGMLEVWGGNQGDIYQEEILIYWELQEGCVAAFWGLWKKGKFVSSVNVWYIPIKKLWVHLGGDVGLWKKI